MTRYNRILVPLDGSELAEQALPFARQLLANGGTLHLAMVHGAAPQWVGMDATIAAAAVDEAFLRASSEYLDRTAATFRAQGLDVVTGVRQGPVAATLCQWATEVGADLIAMTTHGRGGFSRFWLGSVTERVVRVAHTPVLCLKPLMGHAQVPLVIVPLDGSELSEQAIGPGVSATLQLGARLELVRVVDPSEGAWDGALGVPIAVAQEDVVQLKLEAQRYLSGVREELGNGAPATSAVVLTAHNAAAAIVRHAHERRAGLVVMASHRAGWLERSMLGSVTDKVLRSEVGAVLVVRPDATELVESAVRGEGFASVPDADFAAGNPGA